MKYFTSTAIAALALTLPSATLAQDASSWAGFYAGATVGATSTDSASTAVGDDLISALGGLGADESDFDSSPTGATFGIRGGYNHDLGGGWLVGVEASLAFGNVTDSYDDPIGDPGEQITTDIDGTADIKARIGYATGQTLIFGVAGLAYAKTTVTFDDTFVPKQEETLNGYVVGAGIEQMLSPNLSVSVEYLYTDYETTSYLSDPIGTQDLELEADATSQSISVGVNYHF